MNDISLILNLDTTQAQKILSNFFSFAKGVTAQPIVADVKTGQGLYAATGEFKNFGDQIKITGDNTQKIGEKAAESAPIVTSMFGNVATRLIAVNQGLQLFREFFEMFSGPVKAAAELDTLRESFRGTAEDIENFRKATAGTVTEANLIKLSNQATDLGLNMKQQVILFGLAEDAADKYGGSVEEGFQRIVAASEGMSRGLKTIGVQRAVFDDLVKKLAADEGGTLMSLDAETQKRIRLQAIIQASGKTWEDEINKTASSKDQLEQISVVTSEASESIGQLLLPAVKSIASGFKEIVESFTKLPDALKIMFAGFGTMIALFVTLNSTFGALPYLIAGIVAAFISLVNAIKDGNVFVAMLSGGLAGLAIAFIAVQLQSTLAAASILTNLIPAIIGFFSALGPIGWAIAGVGALGAGLIALYSAYGDTTENQLKNIEASNKAIESKIKEKESIRNLSKDYETLNQKLVTGNLSVTEREATENQLHKTLVKIQSVYPSLISSTNDYSGSLDGVKKAAQLAGDEIGRLNKLQSQNLISTQRVQLDKGFGDIKSMLTDTYVDNQTDVAKKIEEAIADIQKGQLSAGGKLINKLSQEFSDLSIQGGTYAEQNLKISQALEKQFNLIEQHKDAYNNLNGESTSSKEATTGSDPIIETVEARKKELQKKIEGYKLAADQLPITQKDELAKYRSLIADTQNQINDLSIDKKSASSESKQTGDYQKNYNDLKLATIKDGYDKERIILDRWHEEEKKKVTKQDQWLVDEAYRTKLALLNDKYESPQKIIESISKEFDIRTKLDNLTKSTSDFEYKEMLDQLNLLSSMNLAGEQRVKLLELELKLKKEISSAPDTMKEVKMPIVDPFNSQLDEMQRKLLDIANIFGVPFTAKANNAIEGMSKGFLHLTDIVDSVKSGFNSAANVLASAGSQAVTIFRQANSVLQMFINTLIQTIAQELILKAVMAALKIIGLSEGGDVATAAAGHATGGPINGPGTETSDSIPAMLSKGEYVVNAKATKQHKPLLDAINYGSIRHFASGGFTGGNFQTSLQPIAINLAPDVKLGLNDLSIALKRTSIVYGNYR